MTLSRFKKRTWRPISNSAYGTCYYRVPGLIGKIRVGNHPAGYSHEGGPAANGSITLSPTATANERKAAYDEAEMMLREANNSRELVEIVFWNPPTAEELEQEKREWDEQEKTRKARKAKEFNNLKAKYPNASNSKLRQAIKSRHKGNQNWKRFLVD